MGHVIVCTMMPLVENSELPETLLSNIDLSGNFLINLMSFLGFPQKGCHRDTFVL